MCIDEHVFEMFEMINEIMSSDFFCSKMSCYALWMFVNIGLKDFCYCCLHVAMTLGKKSCTQRLTVKC